LSTCHRIITGGRPGLPTGPTASRATLTSKITISGWSTKATLGGAPNLYQQLAQVAGGDVAAAVLWVRTFDTHAAVKVGEPSDVYSNYYTNLYGVLVWKQRAQLPPADPKFAAYGRDVLYDQHLAGKPVLDTTDVALRALLALLP
jgi:hypothetical protein